MNLDKIKNLEDLKKVKSEFYSQKGRFKTLKNKIKKATKEEKIQLGKKIEKLKNEAENFFKEASQKLEKLRITDKIKNERIDVTINFDQIGTLHPLTLVETRFRNWLINHGYFESFGSEIETSDFNFCRLNMPEDHPARDMQDSLYISDHKLLRTHNTGFSARELAKNKNKSFAHFSIGPVYRKDEGDATHSHQFVQVDFVAVGNNITIANLIYTIKSLISYVFEKDIKIRIRQSYFPFTEPSIEVDILYNNKWVEILGAGILHQNVMKAAGYTNHMIGFAAGIGIDRIAMIKYKIANIREFYKNDLRFIKQFQGGK